MTSVRLDVGLRCVLWSRCGVLELGVVEGLWIICERKMSALVPLELVNLLYTPDQAGQPLKEEDAIVTDNLVFTEEEIQLFRHKSAMRCPTYGCCPTCMAAGPLLKSCAVCSPSAKTKDPEKRYQIVSVWESYNGKRKWLCGRALARLVGAPVEVPLADHRVACIRTPFFTLLSGRCRFLLGRGESSRDEIDRLMMEMYGRLH